MTEEIRRTAPDALPPTPFNIPSALTASLPNGLRLVIYPDNRLPLVSYRLGFFRGDVLDPDDGRGLTSAMASLLTEGTENHSSRELAEKIERLGASISASSSYDFIAVAASALSLYDNEILELMAEIVLRPAFPEEELDLFRRNTIENLKFQRSQPGFLANEQTARLLYGAHPYSFVSPSQSDIEKLERSRIVEFHRSCMIPNNAILIVVGDVEPSELTKEVAERFGDWQPGAIPTAAFSKPPARSRRSLTIVDRPGSAQANIVISNLAIDRKNPDYFPVLVMNQVLGAGASSRVFMNLREEKGYTYGAYTRFDAKQLAGDFEATAEVRTAVTGESMKEFFFELERIRETDVEEKELADAKNFLTGVFPIRAETQEGLTNLLVTQYLHGLPDDYLQTYREKVAAVSAADVRRVATKYVLPEQAAIVIVGDAGEIVPMVKEYADEIEIFDTDGHPKTLSSETENAVTADLTGNWKLHIDFQGQQMPASLILSQDKEALQGSIETMLGTGTIVEGTVKGSQLTVLARTDIQGEPVDFTIRGKAEGNSVTGTITASIVPEPLTFAGDRELGSAAN